MATEVLMGPEVAEGQLLRVAIEVGALEVGGPLSPTERLAASRAVRVEPPTPEAVRAIRAAIQDGGDPLGDELCRLRPPAQRRSLGAFYTPPEIVGPMVEWALESRPTRLVDAGCGSGRFAAAAIRRDPGLEVVAVDIDPVATLLMRAALAALGHRHTRVLQGSFTAVRLDPATGRTAFLGNPPYVRHHELTPTQKAWAVRAGDRLGCHVSGLSGLHVHFYLATALNARAGDVGCFVTAAEWLDVGYGAAVRELLVDGLGLQALHMVDSRAVPFSDAQATAVIACFEVGSVHETVRLRLVDSPGDLQRLDQGEPLPRQVLAQTRRWTSLFRMPCGVVRGDPVAPLGSIARVHRGLVTGANDFFLLTRERARGLGLEPWCRPAITAAQEILGAGGVIRDAPERKLLLDVPSNVDRSLHPALDSYLRLGETPGISRPAVAAGYICRHRKPWWHLGQQEPPPVVASYMARQAPAFALNEDRLALVNIGHGIYPLRSMDRAALVELVSRLNAAREGFRGQGRTYQGGAGEVRASRDGVPTDQVAECRIGMRRLLDGAKRSWSNLDKRPPPTS